MVFLLRTTLLLILCSPWAFAGSNVPDWVSIDVPASQGIQDTKQLEDKGIAVVSWANAVVEVSSFGDLETIKVANLETQLTPEDPRWDPWLRALPALFHPQEATFRLWVDPSRASEAAQLLGSGNSVRGLPSGPRQVTGWALAALSLLYLALRLWAEYDDSRRTTRGPRSWIWVPLVLAMVGGGLFLALGRPGVESSGMAKAVPSWGQHLWFQQALPYGAQWSDWVPGKAWTYRSYERKADRLAEVTTSLPVPDQAWLKAAWHRLEPRHAARIFPPPNP